MTGAMNRIGTYKKGIDSEQCRRNRNDTRLQLRKNKREEGIQKRRVTTSAAGQEGFECSASSSANTNPQQRRIYSVSDIPRLCAILNNPAPAEEGLLEAVTGFRKILSVEKNPPVKEVINAQILSKIVQLLCHPETKIQFEAAWALTNVASTEYTRLVVENGALPYLVQLLVSSNPDVREQSAWCLGNIAGDATDLRDLVLEAGAMQPILANIENPATESLLGNVVWALSNLCRGKPQPSLDLVYPAISSLSKIVKAKHQSALIDACWALSYLSDGEDSRIQAVMDTGVTMALVELLRSNNASIVTPALRTLGNFVSGNNEQTQAVIDAGVLDCAMELLNHQKKNIRKETCWLLSNIAAGDFKQITSITRDARILRAVLNHVQSSEWEVRKEATWVASNIATGGNDMHVHSLVELGGIDALCSVIDVADPKILLVVLDAIDHILRVGQKCGRDYIGFVDECDGLDKIENLQEHANNQVYEKAVYIIETYYGVEEEEDENLAPAVNGDTFSFGLPTAQKGVDLTKGDGHSQQQHFQTFNFI